MRFSFRDYITIILFCAMFPLLVPALYSTQQIIQRQVVPPPEVDIASGRAEESFCFHKKRPMRSPANPAIHFNQTFSLHIHCVSPIGE